MGQFFDDLVSLGAMMIVRETAISKDQARSVMTSIARGILGMYARTTMYVPADRDLGERDQRLFKAYGEDGPNGVTKYTKARVEQLAAEFQITTRHAYNIIALGRNGAAHRSKKHKGST